MTKKKKETITNTKKKSSNTFTLSTMPRNINYSDSTSTSNISNSRTSSERSMKKQLVLIKQSCYPMLKWAWRKNSISRLFEDEIRALGHINFPNFLKRLKACLFTPFFSNPWNYIPVFKLIWKRNTMIWWRRKFLWAKKIFNIYVNSFKQNSWWGF